MSHDTAKARVAYDELEKRFGRLGRLSAGLSILFWDMETMMPKGGALARAEHITAIKETIHELLSNAEVGELLECAADAELEAWQGANLREMQRNYDHQRAVPHQLVAEMTRATTACQMVWREARPANDFPRILPHLERVVDLCREKAAAKAGTLGLSPYDALLDEFEPGGRAEHIDRIFAQLAGFLPQLVDAVLAKQQAEQAPLKLQGPFGIAAQQALGQKMMRALGFDFERGRLDISAHPFCGGVPDDVRITTRYSEEDFTRGLMGVIHETGHALYEQGLPSSWRYLPVGEARGMAMHES
ncbi:MAG: carboxypeptidase M32, partial [Deltaproteobacteria bacterium]|nr:carboxypeptidase M32 [Deltaproteobacteria bacterium]